MTDDHTGPPLTEVERHVWATVLHEDLSQAVRAALPPGCDSAEVERVAEAALQAIAPLLGAYFERITQG